jgi:GWxTD domain-containing protein
MPATPQTRPSVTLMAQVRPAAPMAQKKQGSSGDPETAYLKWLTGDVAYIITDAERAAFKLLTTDAERERFIEQFWLRRDPTPATSENEFKEEHYRRIAYTNDHYSANGLPGWKTDRGRIYISYGPADEIESHSAGGSYRRPAEEGGGTTTTFPFEQWRYKWIDGVGTNVIIEFVDPTMTGEYRMTMDPKEKDVLVLLNQPRDPQLSASGRAGATVQLMGSSAALISIPLTGYGNHAVNLVCRIVTAEGAPITTFEQTVQGPAPLFTRFVAVRPGAHRLIVLVKDTTSGAVATDDIAFEVK